MVKVSNNTIQVGTIIVCVYVCVRVCVCVCVCVQSLQYQKKQSAWKRKTPTMGVTNQITLPYLNLMTNQIIPPTLPSLNLPPVTMSTMLQGVMNMK